MITKTHNAGYALLEKKENIAAREKAEMLLLNQLIHAIWQ
jgi:hypothetical protein